MRLSELLTPGLIKVPLQSETKEELFDEMVQMLVDAGLLTDRAAALEAVWTRERKMSTGVSRWLGLPHAKLAQAQRLMVAVGVSDRGIDYESLDGEPVHVVVMMFAQEGNPGPHIRALADVCRLFSAAGFVERVRAARTAEDVLELIRQGE